MLTFNIRGENIEVTESIRNYVEKRISKLERYFDNEKTPKATAHVTFAVYPDKTAKVEVTIPLPYIVLRAEETSHDLYASIDVVGDKLERQIRKFKTRINRKQREGSTDTREAAVFLNNIDSEEEVQSSDIEIVRTKRFSLKPMSSEEAALQMEMLGHNFFIFEDGETNATSIIYRRKDGKYGLIETN